MGAEAVRDLLERRGPRQAAAEELRETVADEGKGQKRAKAVKRLKVVEAFLQRRQQSPSDMILDVVPVIPPDLRPMVQLDGGRFATCDLNDLYRRVINRNNRLKQPARPRGSRHHREQREAHAAGGRGRPVRQRPPRPSRSPGAGNRPLKSLADVAQGQAGPLPPEPARKARRLLGPLGHRRRPAAQAAPVRLAQAPWRSSSSSRSS